MKKMMWQLSSVICDKVNLLALLSPTPNMTCFNQTDRTAMIFGPSRDLRSRSTDMCVCGWGSTPRANCFFCLLTWTRQIIQAINLIYFSGECETNSLDFFRYHLKNLIAPPHLTSHPSLSPSQMELCYSRPICCEDNLLHNVLIK